MLEFGRNSTDQSNLNLNITFKSVSALITKCKSSDGNLRINISTLSRSYIELPVMTGEAIKGECNFTYDFSFSSEGVCN